jgi:spermidine synthase
MGATLPWLVAWATRAGGSFGRSLGRLYGINTLGAVLGAGTAGFFLVPTLGLHATAYVVGTLAVVLGAVIFVIGTREAPMEPVEVKPAAGVPRAAHSKRWVAALLFGISGAVALTLEVAWARIFGLVFGSSVYSFALVLAAYLLGVALGSVLWGARLADSRRPWFAFAGLQVALAAGVIFGLWLMPRMPEIFAGVLIASRHELSTVYLTEVGLAGLIAFLPCLALGAIFPVGARILGGERETAAEATGLAYTVNTTGTVTGTMLAGFLLLPYLGVHATLVGCALVSLALGAASWWAEPKPKPKPQAAAPATAKGKKRKAPPPRTAKPVPAFSTGAVLLAIGVIAVGAAALLAPSWNKGLFTMGIYRTSWAGPQGAAPGAARAEVERRLADEILLYYREGLHAIVSVHTVRAIPGALTLRVNGKAEASTAGDMTTQIMVGHVPMLWAQPDPEVCIIGHGSGITAAAALASNPKQLTVVEIEPEVLEASRFFDKVTQTVLEDPRVEVIVEDGRQHLLHSGRQYDVIISQPSNPWIAGINNLFTVDFYRRAKAALKPGGVFCGWVQLYELSPEALASLLSAVNEVFPNAEVFRFRLDLVFVAGWPETRASGRGLLPETYPSPATPYLSRFTFHEDGFVPAKHLGRVSYLLSRLPEVPDNTDDLPYVEYRAPYDMFRATGITLGTDPDAYAEPDPFAALGRWVEDDYRNEVAVAAGKELARLERPARAQLLADELAPILGEDSPQWLALQSEVDRAAAIQSVATYLQRAELAFDANDFAALDANLSVVFASAPHNPGAHLMAGRAAMRREDLVAARSHLGEAIHYGGSAERAEALVNLGIVDMREGRLDEGRAAFLAACEAQPGEPIAYVNLARWYAQAGHIDSATTVLETAQRRAFPLLPIEEALSAVSQGRSF